MNEIIKIKQKRSILFASVLLYIFLFLIPYVYSLEELSLLLHFFVICFIIFLTISLIDSYFVKITLTINAIIKKSLCINKTIDFDEIKEVRVLKYQNSIIVNTKDKRIKIGWDYEGYQEFNKHLIKELEKRQILIIYNNKWW